MEKTKNVKDVLIKALEKVNKKLETIRKMKDEYIDLCQARVITGHSVFEIGRIRNLAYTLIIQQQMLDTASIMQSYSEAHKAVFDDTSDTHSLENIKESIRVTNKFLELRSKIIGIDNKVSMLNELKGQLLHKIKEEEFNDMVDDIIPKSHQKLLMESNK